MREVCRNPRQRLQMLCSNQFTPLQLYQQLSKTVANHLSELALKKKQPSEYLCIFISVHNPHRKGLFSLQLKNAKSAAISVIREFFPSKILIGLKSPISVRFFI